METNRHNNILAFILVSVTVMATFFFSANNKFHAIEEARRKHYIEAQAALEQTPVSAEAVSVFDITDNRKIYGKNDDATLGIASLAKIMTVLVGLNGHNLDDIVYISPEAVKQNGDFGIFAYEKWKIGDLAKFTLIASANDGAYTFTEDSPDLIDTISVIVNKIGLQHTTFWNATGLDITDECRFCLPKLGVTASALEVNAMAAYGLRSYPEVFSATTLSEINLTSESGFEHNFKNTNILIGKLPNLLFSKTGFTETAGGSLAIIFEEKLGHQIAVTVLGSTYDGRFIDMENIVNVLYNPE
jgi:D-alanyl-D-alanine carboxypeptidase